MDTGKQGIFKGDSYVQEGVCHATVKRKKYSGSLSSFDLMSTRSQLKSLKASNSDTIASYSQNQPDVRRSTSNRAQSKESRCWSCITILYTPVDRRYYLSNKCTNLQHSGHIFVPPTAMIRSVTQLSDELTQLVDTMATAMIRPHQIASVLNLLDEDPGSYDSKAIQNLVKKCTNMKDDDLGISSDMTTAEKSIQYLKRYAPSHHFIIQPPFQNSSITFIVVKTLLIQ